MFLGPESLSLFLQGNKASTSLTVSQQPWDLLSVLL